MANAANNFVIPATPSIRELVSSPERLGSAAATLETWLSAEVLLKGSAWVCLNIFSSWDNRELVEEIFEVARLDDDYRALI